MTRRPRSDPWARYEPTAEDPWDLRKVAHLHARAGFGATRAELLRDLASGPEASVDRLLRPPAPSAEEADAVEGLRQTARGSANVELLRVAWLHRILHGSDPLRERLTLFWHGHFATSIKKVESVALMDAQNETLRSLALGDFSAMLDAMVADPAMLVWLDGAGSVRERPNENFAREFLELFTLGPGHYSERDIREVARAFAGWVREPARGGRDASRFRREPSRADDGEKTFLGQAGRWGPADIVRITLERSEAATFLARKLYRLFVDEADEPASDLIEPLAAEIRGHGFAIGHVVGVILRSRHFFSREVDRRRVKSPVEFAAGLVRVLEVPRPDLNPLALAAACDAMGQELFAPPNVKGWDGGRTWINSATLLQRVNWAADVIWGRPENGLAPYDPTAWAVHYEIPPGRVAEALIDLLLRGEVAPEARDVILDAARAGGPDGLRKALQRIANLPEFQLA
jgi:uncharacterized protein (DUF1800 family)